MVTARIRLLCGFPTGLGASGGLVDDLSLCFLTCPVTMGTMCAKSQEQSLGHSDGLLFVAHLVVVCVYVESTTPY